MGKSMTRQIGDIDLAYMKAKAIPKAQKLTGLLNKAGGSKVYIAKDTQLMIGKNKLLDMHGIDTPEAGSVPSRLFGFEFENPVKVSLGKGSRVKLPSMSLSQSGTQKFSGIFTGHVSNAGKYYVSPEALGSPKYVQTLVKHNQDFIQISKFLGKKNPRVLAQTKSFTKLTKIQYGQNMFKGGKVIIGGSSSTPSSVIPLPSILPSFSPSPSSSVSPSISPSPSMSPSPSPSISPSPSFSPSPSPSFSPSISPSFSPSVSPSASVSPSISPSISPSGSPSPSISPSPFIPPPILLPPNVLGDMGGGSRRYATRPKYKYTPSFSAFVFGIRGSKPKGVETGVRLRPITKGFSFGKKLKKVSINMPKMKAPRLSKRLRRII